METFSCFKQKEVINVCDGFRFGYVNDLVIDLSCGQITDIIIPVQTRNGLFFSRDKEYRIPWRAIKRIGKDIILVEVDTHAVCVRKNWPKIYQIDWPELNNQLWLKKQLIAVTKENRGIDIWNVLFADMMKQR